MQVKCSCGREPVVDDALFDLRRMLVTREDELVSALRRARAAPPPDKGNRPVPQHSG